MQTEKTRKSKTKKSSNVVWDSKFPKPIPGQRSERAAKFLPQLIGRKRERPLELLVMPEIACFTVACQLEEEMGIDVLFLTEFGKYVDLTGFLAKWTGKLLIIDLNYITEYRGGISGFLNDIKKDIIQVQRDLIEVERDDAETQGNPEFGMQETRVLCLSDKDLDKILSAKIVKEKLTRFYFKECDGDLLDMDKYYIVK